MAVPALRVRDQEEGQQLNKCTTLSCRPTLRALKQCGKVCSAESARVIPRPKNRFAVGVQFLGNLLGLLGLVLFGACGKPTAYTWSAARIQHALHHTNGKQQADVKSRNRVRRERWWSTAGVKPARELVRSTQ